MKWGVSWVHAGGASLLILTALAVVHAAGGHMPEACPKCLSLLAMGASVFALLCVHLRSTWSRGLSAGEASTPSNDTIPAALDIVTEGVFLLSPDEDRILDANAAASRMLGYSRHELTQLPISKVHEHELSRIQRFCDATLAHGLASSEELSCGTRDGRLIPARVVAARVDQQDGATRMLTVVRDISDEIGVREAAGRGERRFRAVFDTAPLGMAVLDEEGRFVEVNERMVAITGREERQLRGRYFDGLLSRATGPLVGFEEGAEVEISCGDGTQKWCRVDWGTLLDADEHTYRIVMLADVSRRRQAEAELRRAVTTDALTGLPNRAGLLSLLDELVEGVRADDLFTATFVEFDLDDFHLVNDGLGHVAGDGLLQEIAARLERALPAAAVLTRAGDDEFAVLWPSATAAEVDRLVDEMRQAIEVPISVDEDEVFVTASVGVARVAEHHGAAADVVRDAEIAMSRAKERGRGQVVRFDRTMGLNHKERLRLQMDLRRALDDQAITPHYQPIVELQSNRVVGFEALARWPHPCRGMVPPGEFIGLAEECGLIGRIDRRVLSTASHQLMTWRDEGAVGSECFMSVNISARQIHTQGFLSSVAEAIEDCGLRPGTLKLEITESVLMDSAQDSLRLLDSLRALGVQVLVDDFGTGYSSFSYLRRFQPDAVKIDRAFVRVATDEDSRQIVRTITQLAHSLDMKVVVEGVECLEDLRVLREIGCDFGQGFFFGRPVPAESMGESPRSVEPPP